MVTWTREVATEVLGMVRLWKNVETERVIGCSIQFDITYKGKREVEENCVDIALSN